MSSVLATPASAQGAAQDLAGIGSSLAAAASVVSGPTTGIAAAAGDEVSIAVAALFSNFGREFQALSARAQAFHTQFVGLLNASAGAYVSAEVANARQTLLGAVSTPALSAVGGGVPGKVVRSYGAAMWGTSGAPAAASTLIQDFDAFGAAAAAPYQALASNTVSNAQTVFAASQQALNSLFGGVSAEFSQLPANPAAFFNNTQTAVQSVSLIGAPDNITNAVVNHTLGGVTAASAGGLLNGGNPVPVNNVHVQVYQGFLGIGFTPGTGVGAELLAGLATLASSPLSGVLIGAVGPVVSPGVALFNEAHTIFADLTGPTPNPAGALVELIDTPATVVNAFFNGATLNLDPLAPLFNPFVSAGDDGGESINGLSFAFGGLFSPGQVVTGPGNPPALTYYGTGGSALNAVGLDLSFSAPDDDAGATLAVPAIPVGPIGATAGLIDIIGQALGGSLLG